MELDSCMAADSVVNTSGLLALWPGCFFFVCLYCCVYSSVRVEGMNEHNRTQLKKKERVLP